MGKDRAASFPDGIEEKHLDAGDRHAGGWLALAILGILLGSALLGAFGGGPDPTRTVRASAATLAVTAPRVLRNGEFFEIRVRVTARRAIAKPVLAVSPEYWRHLTINAMIPAPAGETFEDGRLLFEYGPLDAGKGLEVKIDGQINPARLGNSGGTVTLRDGKMPLAELPVHLRVFP